MKIVHITEYSYSGDSDDLVACDAWGVWHQYGAGSYARHVINPPDDAAIERDNSVLFDPGDRFTFHEPHEVPPDIWAQLLAAMMIGEQT